MRKLQLNYYRLKIVNFHPNLKKNHFFNQHSKSLYDVIEKEIENLEFVQGENFEFIDSLKKTV